MNPIVRGAMLTGLWCLLWGDLSVANVLSGAGVALLLMLTYPTGARVARGGGGFRPFALGSLAAHLVYQFVVSNVLVARAVLGRRSRVRTGVVACPLRTTSESMITFLANVLALSPGMLPVEVSTSPPVIVLHVLPFRDEGATQRSVAALEARAVRAFGNDDDLARLDRSETRSGTEAGG